MHENKCAIYYAKRTKIELLGVSVDIASALVNPNGCVAHLLVDVPPGKAQIDLEKLKM